MLEDDGASLLSFAHLEGVHHRSARNTGTLPDDYCRLPISLPSNRKSSRRPACLDLSLCCLQPNNLSYRI
jgi:hypothetical protein